MKLKKEHPRYNKVLKLLLAVLLLPLILLFLLIGLVVNLIELLKEPRKKKAYGRSAYYQDLRLPYRRWITDDPYYVFYNEAKKKDLPITFVYQPDNKASYLVSKDTAFFIQPFEAFGYDKRSQQWMAEQDDAPRPLEDVLKDCAALLDEEHRALNSGLLVLKKDLVPISYFSETEDPEEEADFAKELLPSYLYMGSDYLSAYLKAAEETV